jgi:hypothetical protein
MATEGWLEKSVGRYGSAGVQVWTWGLIVCRCGHGLAGVQVWALACLPQCVRGCLQILGNIPGADIKIGIAFRNADECRVQTLLESAILEGTSKCRYSCAGNSTFVLIPLKTTIF